MKVFLSAVSHRTCGNGNSKNMSDYFLEEGIKYNWNLLSFYYIKNDRDYESAIRVRDNSKEVLIDSGAHSFQKGKKVDWVEYTKQYADFIKKFDKPNVIGYFEMDVDNIIGYDKVLELRKILEDVSDKIIPVWHQNRGIEEYKKMCQDYAGKVVAITGFKNADIKDEQYMMFLKYAKKYNCKVHCLGMTRTKVLDKVPFDYVDSSSWAQQSIFGRIGKNKVSKEQSKTDMKKIFLENYKQGMKMQNHYYNKWKKVCKD